MPASTQSIVVGATNPDGTQFSPAVLVTTNVTPSNCPAITGGLQCTITLNVPATNVLFSVAAYAAQNGTGGLLALGQTTSAISSSANAVSISLSGTSTYTFTNLEGQLLSVTFDHIGLTFNVSANAGATTGSGTFTTLANGDNELQVSQTNGGNSFSAGSIAFFREVPNAVVIFSSPGSMSGGDMGAGVAAQGCPTTSATTSFNLTTIPGSGFASGTSTDQAFIIGTGTLAGSSFSATGNAYTISGTVKPNNNGTGPTTCSAGIYSGSSVGAIAFDNLGALVVAQGATDGGSTGETTGAFGFINPATVNIADVAAQTYDGFTGGWSTGPSPQANAAPFNAVPMGANTLQVCAYTDATLSTVSTANCFTAVFSTQPFPGLVLGTAQGSPFAASVAQIEGKYVIFGLSAGSNGVANFALTQH